MPRGRKGPSYSLDAGRDDARVTYDPTRPGPWVMFDDDIVDEVADDRSQLTKRARFTVWMPREGGEESGRHLKFSLSLEQLRNLVARAERELAQAEAMGVEVGWPDTVLS